VKRRSFEKPPLHSALEAPGIQSGLLDSDSAGSAQDVASQQALSHTTEASSCHISSTTATPCSSTNSLANSDSELALLLNGADVSRPGTTTINIGSIPIQVPLAVVEVPAAEAVQPEQQQDAAAATASTKLKATSAEFYPQAYLAAAAATAIAAQSLSSTSHSTAEQQQQQQVAATAADSTPEQQQQPEQAPAAYAAEQQQQQPMADPQQQQQQHWQHWPQQHWQQQQQQMAMAVPMFFPVPVPVPPYVMPAYPFAYHQMQHMQMQPLLLQQPPQQQQQQQQQPSADETSSSIPATPAAAAASSSSYVPLSPAPSLPADTSSLMSTPRGLSGWALAHSSSIYNGSSSSRPGSSANSVISSYSSARGSRQQHQALRDAGTVTVSAMSCVKDAAGALAKVVSRHGSCLLLSLARAGDQAAQATHVAAKSLAVARFYVNAHMAAAGAAGIDAAAVLTGVEAATPHAAAAAAADEEVVFMPFNRNVAAAGSSRAAAAAAAEAEPALGFIVAKAGAKDLPVVLPPPVGIPACMQDRKQQQQEVVSSAIAASSSSSQAAAVSAAPLLKAGANTDVNKLSNAIIHNVLDCSHVALQLAGAAACHVAMKALIKARARLQRKFGADIVATASFANEDTSSSIGRSTVFLRLDVMRSNLLQQLASGMAANQQQQQQLAGAV
jgi:stage V sporulation protein SpoVS